MEHSRRDFLSKASCGLLGKAALVTGFERFCDIGLLAAPIAPNDYRALVCIFLFGGNDANNTVISLDRYSDYASIRGALAIPQDQLLPIEPLNRNGANAGRFGLHPALTALQPLWSQGRLAVLCNVGTLLEPLTKAAYLSSGSRPYQLFSHSDQQNQWQTALSNGSSPVGWGGRMADATQDALSGFPTVASLAGMPVFSAGQRTRPLAISPAPTPLNQTLRLKQPDDALKQILTLDQENTSPLLVRAATKVMAQSLTNSDSLNTDPPIVTVFPNTGLANQLKQVAKLIAVSSQLGLRRQIFFCSLGGFDTHSGQLATQTSLLGQLGDAMAAFYAATIELGVSSKVATFTLSDFSRTFKPAGTATNTVGSDHAWGSHQFIMGDVVRGHDFYGSYPALELGGANDTDTGTTARGRWIPSVSVDQYASTLALWYGLPLSDLASIFPNIGRFTTADLGFLSA